MAAVLADSTLKRERMISNELVNILLRVLGGLALFLYGLSMLTTKFRTVAGARARYWFLQFTSNRITAVLTGIGVTAALTSSSVTIILIIALVNARLLTVMQASGLILGCNIGTTVSSQIFAFDLARYSPVIVTAGLLIQALAHREGARRVGGVLLAAGIVFFGLQLMGDALHPLKDYAQVAQWVRQTENVWTGALVGAAISGIIQSSSATMGITISLASQGLVTVPAGVAVMFGAEVGTCLDTFIAALGRSRSALSVGLFHALFNIFSALTGISLVRPFLRIVEAVSGGAGASRQIANAQLLFNAIGVLLVLPFLGPITRALTTVVSANPDSGSTPKRYSNVKRG